MREFRLVGQGRVPPQQEGTVERKNMRFTIKVISAQQLMRPASLPPNRTLDPYVEVEVFHASLPSKASIDLSVLYTRYEELDKAVAILCRIKADPDLAAMISISRFSVTLSYGQR